MINELAIVQTGASVSYMYMCMYAVLHAFLCTHATVFTLSSAVLSLLAMLPGPLQAAVRGYMSREHQMLTWHTLEGDLEAKQKALAETDKSKVRSCCRCRYQHSLLCSSYVGAACNAASVKGWLRNVLVCARL
jgi:hypothetical protein